MLGGKQLEVAGLNVTAKEPADASLELVNGKWQIGDGKGEINVAVK